MSHTHHRTQAHALIFSEDVEEIIGNSTCGIKQQSAIVTLSPWLYRPCSGCSIFSRPSNLYEIQCCFQAKWLTPCITPEACQITPIITRISAPDDVNLSSVFEVHSATKMG